MSWLRELAQDAFGRESVLTGLALKEQGNVFSLRLPRSEGVLAVGVRPDASPQLGGGRETACDGLFLLECAPRSVLLVVLVELKGADVAKAIKQLEATFLKLCPCHGTFHAAHFVPAWRELTGADGALRSPHPKGLAIGCVVSRRRGIQLKQQDRARLAAHGLLIRFLRDAKGLGLSDLLR